jgi:23S rRNA (guanosine2251-2'-O)-methyltransferase
MRDIVLIVHNLRSCHNVGSLLRTAEGLGVSMLYLSGYTPFPALIDDPRLPHEAEKTTKQIRKTALGAELTQQWQHTTDIMQLITTLKGLGYTVAGVEQAKDSIALPEFTPPQKIALIVGREVEGLEFEVIAQCDKLLEIPMYGQKESFNVVQAAAMAIYHCRFAGSLTLNRKH